MRHWEANCKTSNYFLECAFNSVLVCHVSSGWRVGWAIAPAFLASAIRNIHGRVTDSAPAPFQEAALTALRSPPEYFESLRRVSVKSTFEEIWY